MLDQIKKRIFETIRLARHNWLHLKIFKIRYDGKVWHVTDRNGNRTTFPYYPYLIHYEIDGYLRHGKWPLREGMVVVDAGGCYGEFALYAARCVGKTGRVLMLEPDSKNIDDAHKYFESFGGKPPNLEIIPVGLWKSPGVLRFAAGLGQGSLMLAEGQPAPAGGQIIEVPVESLKSLADRFGLQRMDLVKMDIEGAEIEAVQGAAQVIKDFHPRFSIASYHMRDGKPTSAILEPMFREFGYEAETGVSGHPTTWAAKHLDD